MPTSRIIILGRRENAEGRLVYGHLEPRRALIIDDAWIQRSRTLEWSFNGTSTLLNLDGLMLHSDDIASVFVRTNYRRGTTGLPSPVILSPATEIAPEYASFAQSEAESTLLAPLLSSSAVWINHPTAEFVANHKLHQLAVAHRLGLRIPQTIVSNNVKTLTDFWNELSGHVIAKAVSTCPSALLNEPMVTRQIQSGDLDRLSQACAVPTLFQELIPAEADIRVTMVGPTIFGTRICSQEGHSRLDWRLDQTVRMVPYQIDPALARMLQRVRCALGLAYAAADLRLTPAGEPVFLEINPQGAFLFVEQLTDAPISLAIAPLLSDPSLLGSDPTR